MPIPHDRGTVVQRHKAFCNGRARCPDCPLRSTSPYHHFCRSTIESPEVVCPGKLRRDSKPAKATVFDVPPPAHVAARSTRREGCLRETGAANTATTVRSTGDVGDLQPTWVKPEHRRSDAADAPPRNGHGRSADELLGVSFTRSLFSSRPHHGNPDDGRDRTMMYEPAKQLPSQGNYRRHLLWLTGGEPPVVTDCDQDCVSHRNMHRVLGP